jgi:putative N6-adenine-specific DNA methylase
VYAVPWENVFPKNAKISVNGKCVKSQIFAVTDSQRIVKKAIAKRLMDKYHLASLNENGTLYQVEFHLVANVCSVLINTSGQGLHKRGYRNLVGIAPIKETLASALVLSSDYYYKNPFLDPFCGSGTIPIETAMIALNVASGKLRDFAYQNFEYFPKNAYKLCLEEALDLEKPTASPVIFASDIDKKAVELAKQHARRAGVEKAINFSVKNVKDFYTELKNGTIVTNPPYGERVYDKDEAEACYKHLRKVYDKLDSWSLFLITSHKGFERVFGIKSDRNRKLFNSNKECRYYYYYTKKDRE